METEICSIWTNCHHHVINDNLRMLEGLLEGIVVTPFSFRARVYGADPCGALRYLAAVT